MNMIRHNTFPCRKLRLLPKRHDEPNDTPSLEIKYYGRITRANHPSKDQRQSVRRYHSDAPGASTSRAGVRQKRADRDQGRARPDQAAAVADAPAAAPPHSDA